MQLEALLAAVLDVEPSVVTADSSAGELEAWDSLAHLPAGRSPNAAGPPRRMDTPGKVARRHR